MSLRLFVIYLDYRLYSSILFKMEVCGLQEVLLIPPRKLHPPRKFEANTY